MTFLEPIGDSAGKVHYIALGVFNEMKLSNVKKMQHQDTIEMSPFV